MSRASKANRRRAKLARTRKALSTYTVCECGKTCYPSEFAAVTEAARRRGARVYVCRRSGAWHLTSRKRNPR